MFRLTTYSTRPDRFDVELHDGREGILLYRIKDNRLVWTVQIYFMGSEVVQAQENFETIMAALDFLTAIVPKDKSISKALDARKED